MSATAIKTTLKSCFRGLGFDVVRVRAATDAAPNAMIDDGRSMNMRDASERFAAVPGMLPPERGRTLYLLAYAQQLRGDVIEIGSWQGRSTCYLAQACRDADNGVVRAIDHFRGNAQAASQYVVGRDDLSDLEGNFRRNIEAAGLADHVQLYNMPSAEAAAGHAGELAGARLLFIDGDHSHVGVCGDIERFAPLLAAGGLIAFDDYHSDGHGVVRAVRELILDSPRYGQFTQFPGLLVARKLC